MKNDTKNQKISMDTKIELHMCANPDYLCVARAAARQVAQISGLEKKETEQITLAVVEALTMKRVYSSRSMPSIAAKPGVG